MHEEESEKMRGMSIRNEGEVWMRQQAEGKEGGKRKEEERG